MISKLEIKNLVIKTNSKEILKNISFVAEANDIVAIVGPNGAGKSTLLKAVMNHFDLETTQGEIKYNGSLLNNKPTNEIADLGIYYCSQNPIELEGIKLIELYKMILNNTTKKPIELFDLYKNITPLFKELNLDMDLLNRYSNVNFSGGQKKKNELVQIALFNPEVLLLDELDSGADIDTVKIIANKILKFRENKIVLIISHQFELLQMIRPNKVILLSEGSIIKTGDFSLLSEIFTNGYSKYLQKPSKEFEDIDYLKNGIK